MFKNRALRIQLIKTNAANQAVDSTQTFIHPDDVAEYATIAAYWTKRAAVGVSVLYAGKKVLDTASEIAVIAAHARIK